MWDSGIRFLTQQDDWPQLGRMVLVMLLFASFELCWASFVVGFLCTD